MYVEELNPAENTVQRKKGHLGMEIKDHFRYGHLYFSGKTQCLLNFLLKYCHLAIKRCAIKFEIALAAATPVKSFAARTINRILTGFLQFMGDSVQPADHRTIGIQDAQFIKIKRAHLPHGSITVW